MDITLFKSVCDSWIGTPWRHYQHIKGVGVDCVNFIAEVAIEINLIKFINIEYYPRDWAQHNSKSLLIARVSEFCNQVVDYQVGDILVYRYGQCASHAGFVYAAGVGIHAHIRRGVTLFGLSDIENRLHSIWRFRGI